MTQPQHFEQYPMPIAQEAQVVQRHDSDQWFDHCSVRPYEAALQEAWRPYSELLHVMAAAEMMRNGSRETPEERIQSEGMVGVRTERKQFGQEVLLSDGARLTVFTGYYSPGFDEVPASYRMLRPLEEQDNYALESDPLDFILPGARNVREVLHSYSGYRWMPKVGEGFFEKRRALKALRQALAERAQILTDNLPSWQEWDAAQSDTSLGSWPKLANATPSPGEDYR